MWETPWLARRERVVACRDLTGAVARVVICPDGDGHGVLVSAPGIGPLRLTDRQASRLSRALAGARGRAR